MKQQYNQSIIQKNVFGLVFIFFGFIYATYGQQIDVRLQNNGCQIATYEFEVTGTLPDGADNIDWDFGNLNISTDQPTGGTPSASYNSSGTYFITAKIQNASNITLQTITKEIYVYKNATPEFSADSDIDCYPLTVDFEDLTDLSNVLVGNVIERKWIFGDGNTVVFTTASEGTVNLDTVRTDVEHTYANVGDFQVTLVLKTKSGQILSGVGVPTCTGSLVKEKFVKVRHLIEPKFSHSVNTCDENGFDITFENESVFPTLPPPVPQIQEYEWRYYEGGFSSGNGYVYTTMNNANDYNRAFTSVGTHDIVLQATTKDGCESFTTVTVTIPDNSVSITPSSSTICQSQPATFSGALADAVNSSGAVTSWTWDIDGTPYTSQNPTHAFSSTGTKDIFVTATFADGCTFATATTFTVNPSTLADFTPAGTTDACQPQTLNFQTASGSDPANTYAWTIKRGTTTVATGSGTQISQLFDQGTYDVELKVTTPEGCVFTQTRTNHVSIVPPSVTITDAPETPLSSNTNQLLPIDFTATPNSPNDPTISNYTWSVYKNNVFITSVDRGGVNDFLTAIGAEGTENSAEYAVGVTITTSTGCNATDFTTINFTTNNDGTYSIGNGDGNQSLWNNFNVANTCGTSVYNFTHENTASGATYDWNFGDGTIVSSGTNPISHSYTPLAFSTVRNVFLTVSYGGTFRETYEQQVYIPIASENFDFNTTGLGVCSPAFITFENIPKSDIPGERWNWNFGNGTQARSDNANFSRQYTAPGFYTVTLELESGGCNKYTRNVVVWGLVPKFETTSTSQACAGVPVDFTDLSENPPNNTNLYWHWYFGSNSSTGTLFHSSPSGASHTFGASGDYPITLKVTDDKGCSDETTQIIHIQTTPEIKIDAPSLTCTTDGIVLTNNTTGGADNFIWEFQNEDGSNPEILVEANSPSGDLFTVAGKNKGEFFTTAGYRSKRLPKLKFNKDGEHFVTLTATNSTTGCEDTFTTVIRTVTPRIQITATGTGTVDNSNVIGTTEVVTYINEAGTQMTTVAFKPDSSPSFTTPGNLSSINFSCPLGIVQFQGALRNDYGGKVVVNSWYWKFGDGNTAFTQNPKHEYILPGTYRVELFAETNIGCGGQVPIMTGMVKVEGPIGEFDFDPKRVCYPETVTFTAFNLRKFKTIEWDFGDGETSEVFELTNTEIARAEAGEIIVGKTQIDHTYTKPGVFYPNMVLNDEKDCKISYPTRVGPIYSSGTPNAFFNITEGTQVCQDLEVTFSDASTENADTRAYINSYNTPVISPAIVKWEWHYGINGGGTDGAFITGDVFDYVSDNPASPSEPIAFNSAGNYTITLAATTEFGCTDYFTQFITIVKPDINAFMTIDPTAGCPGSEVTLKADGSFANLGGVTKNDTELIYTWNFGETGNPATSTEITTPLGTKQASFVYDEAGIYTVSLTARDPAGCIESNIAAGSIQIWETHADFAREPSFGEAFLTVNFTTAGTYADGGVQNIQWNFPEGGPNISTTTIDNPTVSFSSAGVHDVFLTVTSNKGCVSTVARKIIVLNNPPVALNDFYTVQEDQFITVNAILSTFITGDGSILMTTVSGTDFDINGDGLVDFVTATNPSNGFLSVGTNGLIYYRPNPNFAGIDQFSYRIWDDFEFNTATGVEDLPPIAIDDFYEVPFNTALDLLTVNVQLGLLKGTSPSTPNKDFDPDENDTDIDIEGGDFTTTTAKGGTIEVRGSSGRFRYTPPVDFTGIDYYDYTIFTNGKPDKIDVGRAFFLVNNTTNNPPQTGTDFLTVTGSEKVKDQRLDINDNEPDGDNLVYVAVTNASTEKGGKITIDADGEYSYEAPKDFAGGTKDYYVYTVCDDNPIKPLCSQGLLEITIEEPNIEPVGVPDIYSTPLNTFISISASDGLLMNDFDPNNGQFITAKYLKDVNDSDVNTTNEGGFITINADGTFRYQPLTGFTGIDEFTYQVCDNQNPELCSEGVVQIEVGSSNHAPVAQDDKFTTASGGSITGNVTANNGFGKDTYGTDIDGHFVTVSATYNSTTFAGGRITILNNGNFTYHAPDDIVGTVNDYYVYEICDNQDPKLCDQATIFITVTPAIVRPVAVFDNSFTTTNTPAIGATSLSTNDIEPNAGFLTASNRKSIDNALITATQRGGEIFISANGTYNYYPPKDFIGTDNYIYEVCNSDNQCDRATLTIQINAKNTPPIATNGEITFTSALGFNTVTERFTTVTGTLFTSVSDAEGNPIKFTTVTNARTATDGRITIDANGNFTYLPGFEGNGANVDYYVYEVCDEGNPEFCTEGIMFMTLGGDLEPIIPKPLQSNFATVTIFVGSEDDPPPTARDDQETTRQGVTVTFTTTILNNDESFEAYVGAPTSSIFTTAPFLSVGSSMPFATINVLGIGAGGGQGVLSIDETGQGTYAPDPNFYGVIEFFYTAWDDGFNGTRPPEFATASIFITVNGYPTPSDDSFEMSRETAFVSGNAFTGASLTSNLFASAGNSQDTDSYSFITGYGGITPQGSAGSLIASNGGGGTFFITADGKFGYEPNTGFSGSDWFTYQLCDNVASPNELCAFATVYITVNENPTPQPDNDITLEGRILDSRNPHPDETAFLTSLLVNDTDPNEQFLTVFTTVIQSQTFNGSSTNFTTTTNAGNLALVSADGHFQFIPADNYHGNDYFVYEVCDDSPAKLCSFATAYITVNANPEPQNNTVGVEQEVAYFATASGIFITANDTDPFLMASASPFFSVTTTASNPSFYPAPDANGFVTTQGGSGNGIVRLLENGAFEYRPKTGFYGDDWFAYQYCDNIASPNEGCGFATVFITVNGKPVAIDDNYKTPEDTPFSGDVSYNDGDPENEILTFTTISNPSNGTLTNFTTTDGTFIYLPDPNFTGQDSYTYEACDPLGQCDFATVFITVVGINDPPIAYDDIYQTPFETQFTTTVTGGLLARIDGAPVVGETTGAPNNDDFDPDGTNGNDTDLKITPVLNATTHFGGTITIQNDGVFTYDPPAGFVGTDFYRYEVCDVQNPKMCTEATVFITVTGSNDAVYASTDYATTPINTPYFSDVSGGWSIFDNDHDPEGTPLARPGNADDVARTTQESGTIFISADGTFKYVPATNFVGVDVYEYEVCDQTGLGNCTTAFITITVGDANRPPIALHDNNSTLRNIPVSGTVINNDSDPDGDPIAVTVPFQTITEKGGFITVNPNGKYTYTPAKNFVGNDLVPYTICDQPHNQCASAILFLTVEHSNAPPEPIDDYYFTKENAFVTGNVKTNDADPDATDIYAFLSVTPSQGTTIFGGFITVLEDGTFYYDPPAGFTGVDKYDYTICDDESPVKACADATIFISVEPINNPPVALNDWNFTSVNTPVTGTVPLQDNDYDPDNDFITLNTPKDQSYTTDLGGTLFLSVDGTYTYTPLTGFTGWDIFRYKICDIPHNECTEAKLTILVVEPNDNLPPVAIDEFVTISENTVAFTSILKNGETDPNTTDIFTDGSLSFQTVTNVETQEGGRITISDKDGNYTYTPAPNFNGIDRYTYSVCDDEGLCAEAVLTITVESIDTPPIARDNNNETNENIPLVVNDPNQGILPNDFDVEDDLKVTVATTTTQQGGFITVYADGTYRYQPPTGFTGNDQYQYTVQEDKTSPQFATAILYITVRPVNDLPNAENDYVATSEDTPVTGRDIRLNDTDPEDGTLTVNTTPIVPPRHGSVVINLDGAYTYTPEPNYNGTDQFTYEVCEADGDCAIATVFIDIYPINDPPVAYDDIDQTTENTNLTVTNPADGILGDVDGVPVTGETTNPNNDDHDPDGANVNDSDITVTAVIAGETKFGGTIFISANGTYNYTPRHGFNGVDEFVYEVCDIQTPTQCTNATLFITVTPINDPLVAINDYGSTSINTPFDSKVSLFANDYDPEGRYPLHSNSMTTVTLTNANGTVDISPDGRYRFTPTTGFTGTTTYTYEVYDQDGQFTSAVLTIYVGDVSNRPPQANPDQRQTNEDMPVTGQVLNNDSDPNAVPLEATQVTEVTTSLGGKITIDANGNYTYYPPKNFTGNDTYEYEVCQTSAPNLCAKSVIFLTVVPWNDPPEPLDENITTNVDAPISGNTKINDRDPDDEFAVLEVNAVTNVETVWGGKITIDTDGNYTYTPPRGFTGNDRYVYTICDDELPFASCSEATIFITVQSVNNPPLAQNDHAFTTINQPVTGAVSALGNDFDPDGDHIVITSVADEPTANGGRITINADGVYTYTPPHGFQGTDVYEYTICETGVTNPKCVTAKIIIYVGGNQPPVPLADNNTTPEDTPVSGTAKTNDSDPDTPFADLTITAKTNDVTAEGGTMTIDNNGNYTYTPAPNFVGNDTYVYEICDNTSPTPLCAEAIIYITVTPAIDVPIANDDYDVTFKNVPLVVTDPYFGVLRNDYHNEHRPLKVTPFTSVTTPNGGTLTMYEDGTYTYISDPFFKGLDQYPYEVCDDQTPAQCSNATLFITVLELLNAPITEGEEIFVGQDIPYTETTSLLSNDRDPESTDLTINTTPTVNPRHGTLVINPDGTYTYTPNAGYYGQDSFVYEACDEAGDCSTETVIININAKPLAEDDENVTIENEPVMGNIMPNDQDPDNNNLTAQIDTNPNNGTVILNPDGTYTYTPDEGFYGEDEFTYTICDDGNPQMCSEPATVRIFVNGKPDLVVDNYNVGQDGVLEGTSILDNDSDPNDGHNLVLNTDPITQVEHGELTINPDGTFVYEPNEGFFGNDFFVYEVCDDFEEATACEFTTVFITINGKPVALDDQEKTNQGVPVTAELTILNNDSDPDDHNLFLSVTPIIDPENGSVIINEDGTYTYTPNPDLYGVDRFVYEICDDGNPILCDFATVFITVNGAVVAENDYYGTEENTPVTGTMSPNDYDRDGGDLIFSTVPVQNPVNGSVTINSDGTFTYTPFEGFVGDDSFVYEVCDNDDPVFCTTAIVFISIVEVTIPEDDIYADADGDGIPDEIEGDGDTDGDGIPDSLDTDSDNDGIPDGEEAGDDPSNPDDTDLDGIPDFQDEDADNDNIPDDVEAGDDPNNPVDSDGDGVPDYQDRDADNDNIPDDVEAGDDPNNPVDTDGDGLPDYQDEDSDNDGIPDNTEAGDDPNNPVDTDGNGVPDFRDTDSDGDGIPDEVEQQDTDTGILTDSDGNGIPDVVENPDPNNLQDTDNDGLLDHLDTDSDNDGIPDSVEAGNDPNNPVDSDGDGIPDYLDPDADNDGIPDYVEGQGDGTTPVDTDGDGVPDYLDTDSDDDDIPDAIEAGDDPTDPVDTDGDGTPDYRDPIHLIIWEGISLNGDGKNDSWIIDGIRLYPNNRIKIFNRWGNLVFYVEGYNNENVIWYGQSNQGTPIGDEILPDGTYFYVIDLDGDGNEIEPIGGYVIINR